MATISFADVVASLPRGDEFLAKHLPNGLAYPTAPRTAFVPPTFAVERPPQLGRTGVVLVSAPGAVGKSTLASEMAYQLGAAVWDLSKMNVGTNTFAGTILQAYGAESHGVLKRIGDGRWVFVLDAFDEAHVRAGAQNFEAFVGELADLATGDKPKPTLVLLARTDTADLLDLLLEEKGVVPARYRVEYFECGQAMDFIEKRLDELRASDNRQPLHRQQSQAFALARDALFGHVYDLFELSGATAWNDMRIRNFLGYAPVLEALTKYLDVANYKTLIDNLRGKSDAGTDPWRFLADIINFLLQREEGKLKTVAKPNLEAVAAASRWNAWSDLYRPNEQNARVLRHALSLPPAPPRDLQLPTALANKYEDALRTFLPEHPFLAGRAYANVVFKEYSFAWGTAFGDEETSIALRRAMSDRDSPFLPSLLFSRFLVNSADGGDALLDGQDFGIVYESLLARSDDVAVSLVEGDDAVEARISLKDSKTPIEFSLLDSGAGVHFWRRLENADIVGVTNLRLGLPGQRFSLGPSVNASCTRLSVESDYVDIDTRGNIWLHADSYTAKGNVALRLRDASAGSLRVNWNGVAYPWATYKSAPTGTRAVLGETPRGDALRKFLLMFNRQRTRKTSTVQNARWSSDQLAHRDDLLDLALRRGVIAETQLSSLEFDSDFDSLKSLLSDEPTLTPPSRQFLVEYLGEDLVVRLLQVAQT